MLVSVDDDATRGLNWSAKTKIMISWVCQLGYADWNLAENPTKGSLQKQEQNYVHKRR